MTIQNLSNGFRNNLRLIILFFILTALLGWAQAATVGLTDPDGFYHIKMAQLMRSSLTPKFIWLPLTILSPSGYVDHHFLFHILLIPFSLGNLLTGGKIALVLFAALAITSSAALLRAQKVAGAELWAILIFASSWSFVYRMSMIRGQSLSLLWLVLTAGVLLARKDKFLVPIGMTYVWLYDAFPLIFAVVGVYFVAEWLLEKEMRWQPVAYAVAGVSLGLLVNPYFPRNLTFIYNHLAAKLDINSISVGNEWYPYSTSVLLKNSSIALLALIAGAVGLGWHPGRMNLGAALMLGLTVVFGVMVFQSRRFIEYFPPFSVMFCAFAWQPILSGIKFHWAPAALLAILLPGAVLYSLQHVRADIGSAETPFTFAGSSQWLIDHTPPGSMVFHTDWDQFPELFFYNTHNVYIVGLDATYLSRASEKTYNNWVDLTRGKSNNLAADITKEFNTCYAITDLNHKIFLDAAKKDHSFKEEYRDKYSVVYSLCN